MLIDIYEEEVVWVHSVWVKIIDKDEARIISKQFWFIKRLVDNDKIDFDKCWLDVKDYLSYSKRYDKWIVMAENYDNDTFVVREFYSPYEQLLMLLAISDNPIDLLCEIIKN